MILEIKNLTKKYKNYLRPQNFVALNNINLKIKKGEFISVLGPSGSGKTTLLRSINGLETIDKGEVYFDKKNINQNNLSYVQSKTGMIFQEYNLVNNISVINNVLTGLVNSSSKLLSMFYIFSKQQRLQALHSLETVGLLDKSYNRADELSGGQRQRVGIARAIIKKPILLLADEPVASLDPKASNLIMNLLKKISKELKITIICNLHNINLAKIYSDRVVGLLNGSIKFIKKPSELNDKVINSIFQKNEKEKK